jgi:hypothetical protein
MIRFKNILYLFLLSSMATILAGCEDKLNQLPTTSVTDANFWKTPVDLSLACNYLYMALPGHNASSNPQFYLTATYQEFYGNFGFGSGGNQVSNGTQLVPATSTEWREYYRVIRAANNIIEKSVNTEGDSLLINKFRGEARFFRALAYFELVKRFGDVPLLTQTVTEADTLLYTPRSKRELVLDQVYKDLDYSATFCPQPDKQITTEYGRITRTAALGMLSRVALFEGTRAKYHGYGDPAKHLNISMKAAKTIIDEGKHSLFTYATEKDSSYLYLFRYQAQGVTRLSPGIASSVGSYAVNKETLLPKLYFGGGGTEIQYHTLPTAISLKQFTSTKSLVNTYLYSDGLPAGKSTLYKAKEDSSLTEFMNRDPRLGMTINNKTVKETSNIGNFRPTTSYVPRKWLSYFDNGNPRSYMNFWIIRYGEILLNYAEAKYELNGNISDADLDLTVNALRNRATNSNPKKLPLLTNAFTSANGLNLRDEIRREREIELACEGFHYWDLIRWKTAETELPKDLLGPRYFPKEIQIGTAIPKLTADSVIILETGRKFNPIRDYLWPIPTQEIALSAGKYTQNPNW